MSESLQLVKSLAPIAEALRSREEQISAIKQDVAGKMCDGLALMAEQGRDLLLAKTKLAGSFSFIEWLSLNVPNVPQKQASKYERIASEALNDPRQCAFAFFDPAQRSKSIPERTGPSPWESAFKHAHSMLKVIRDNPLKDWPEEQKQVAAKELEPLAKALWPDRF